MQRKDIPNFISLTRVLLVLPVVSALLERHFQEALLWFAIAGLSDGIDGMIARRFGWQSRLGSLLDPIADKLLLATSYGCLTYLGLSPSWLTALIIGRDVLIFAGSLACYFHLSSFHGNPSLLSKFNTFCQIALAICIITNQAYWALPERSVSFLMGLAALTTLLSGLHYLKVWGKTTLEMLHL